MTLNATSDANSDATGSSLRRQRPVACTITAETAPFPTLTGQSYPLYSPVTNMDTDKTERTKPLSVPVWPPGYPWSYKGSPYIASLQPRRDNRPSILFLDTPFAAEAIESVG